MQPVISLDSLQQAPFEIRTRSGSIESLVLIRKWDGPICRSTLTNTGDSAVRVLEIVLFSGALPDEEIPFYGEGFQQNGQRGGTLRNPEDIGFVPDRLDYNLPQTPDRLTVYSLVSLQPVGRPITLMSFTTCHRFSAEFRFAEGLFEVIMDTEGLSIAPGETWTLEEFMLVNGNSKADMFEAVAIQMECNHPRLPFPETPTGWCSWYHYGPDITEEAVIQNLDVIARETPGLKYIQIDDGYQPFMGDWLAPGDKFPHGIRWLCDEIRARGFEPAIWVAPFIAETDSAIFREHPEWFVTGDDGKPISSDKVSYEGWRCVPWYVLDTTQKEVQDHFTHLFRIMREEWGCTYFKLDANFWGAMHGCHRADPNATRIEAYRRGMEAILRGSGDGFILGCNAPVWGSLGLIHGNRVTNDIMRYWDKFKMVARELFNRNWQNNRLWINDPDCFIMNNIQGSTLTPDEFGFHRAMIQASGGMILTGDDMTALNAAQLESVRKLLPAVTQAACFLKDDFSVGIQEFTDHQVLFFFNWGEQAVQFEYSLPATANVTDFWSGEVYGLFTGLFSKTLAPHSAGVFTISIQPN